MLLSVNSTQRFVTEVWKEIFNETAIFLFALIHSQALLPLEGPVQMDIWHPSPVLVNDLRMTSYSSVTN
jgi:hypothetical protein